mmetsp:Transcript_5849/g.15273  ORF Transcript_5849/g.15273 Transcript_5849/m.15273 type:complete len:278 (+) Transcript_5849:301-1134(+)
MGASGLAFSKVQASQIQAPSAARGPSHVEPGGVGNGEPGLRASSHSLFLILGECDSNSLPGLNCRDGVPGAEREEAPGRFEFSNIRSSFRPSLSSSPASPSSRQKSSRLKSEPPSATLGLFKSDLFAWRRATLAQSRSRTLCAVEKGERLRLGPSCVGIWEREFRPSCWADVRCSDLLSRFFAISDAISEASGAPRLPPKPGIDSAQLGCAPGAIACLSPPATPRHAPNIPAPEELTPSLKFVAPRLSSVRWKGSRRCSRTSARAAAARDSTPLARA